MDMLSLSLLEELLANNGDQLFYKATYDNHCPHHLLPVAKSNKYGLRVELSRR